MNVVFKVYWNNPIEMVAEAGTQQLTFEVPLGAIISNPSSGGGTASYPSFTGNAAKVLTVNATEDDVEWTTAVTQVYVDQEIVDLNATLSTSISSKADVNYVDTQDELLQDQINLKADATAVNQVLSTKADLVGGVIPSSQLPSYVDDVLSFPDLVSFPSLGEDGKIYIAEDVNKTYRWGGSSYVEIGGGGVALGETSSTAYRGDRGKIAYYHTLSQGNPHNSTTSDITEGTRLYFTEARVLATALTGFVTTNSTPIVATDNIVTALGKAQGQLNTLGATWVNITTTTGVTVSSKVDIPNTGFQVAKIDGSIWMRGRIRFKTSAKAGEDVFILAQTSLLPDMSWFDPGWLLQRATLYGNGSSITMDFAGSSFFSTLNLFLSSTSSATGTNTTYYLPPTAISRAAN